MAYFNCAYNRFSASFKITGCLCCSHYFNFSSGEIYWNCFSIYGTKKSKHLLESHDSCVFATIYGYYTSGKIAEYNYFFGRYHKGRALRYIFLKRHCDDEVRSNLPIFTSIQSLFSKVLKRMPLQSLTQIPVQFMLNLKQGQVSKDSIKKNHHKQT